MAKRAFLFPGQGSQFVGMAKDLHDNSDLSKEMISKAEEAIGVDISKIMFEGPEDSLKQTDITQPAIFLHSMLLSALIKSIKPDMVAGHSLGEYSALVAANAVDFIDAFKLVRYRGQFMLQAGIEQPGTMAAVIGLPMEKLEEICKVASSEGIVQCANFNSPGQVVISGSIDGVMAAMAMSKSNGARLVKQLVVSGAFHSPLMQSASDKLKEKLEITDFRNAEIPVYANVTAKPVTDKDEIRNLLLAQLNAPVRWEETIRNMIEDGTDEFVEVGPGKVLQGLVKRINNDVSVSGIDKFSDVERYL
ncbi:ACP S-malonyltransferase [Bacteroidota bacterium]